MCNNLLATVFIVLAIAGRAEAQEHHRGANAPGAGQTSYAGYQNRGVKALSAQQISDLRNGRGMGLALAGELNGYPGPAHSLELADRLGLSLEQRSQTEAALAAMTAETKAIGEEVITGERALDRLFADRAITQGKLDAAVMTIALAQGRLRAAHLRYHLRMADVLSPEQAATYALLRGYEEDDASPAHTR